MDNMLATYFSKILNAKGYPGEAMDIRYRLSFAQGDGVAFYGSMNADNLRVLVQRLYANSPTDTAFQRVRNLRHRHMLNELLDLVETYSDDSVIINKTGSHMYDHCNTMVISFQHDHDEMMDVIEGEAENPSPLLAKSDDYRRFWDDLMESLSDDIRDISNQLANDGHDIILAGRSDDETVWSFETAQFSVSLTEIADEHFDISDWDNETFISTVNDLIAGKQCFLGLRAQVADLETGDVLGEDSLYGIVLADPATRIGHEGFRREIVSNAIHEARECLAECSRSRLAA